jgi:hypothetical protein
VKRIWIAVAVCACAGYVWASDVSGLALGEAGDGTSARMEPQGQDDSEARPPVSPDDVRIVERARAILSSPEKWNRTDTRVCPATEKTFSLYCALEAATVEVGGSFEHRGAAMQEARFVIDDELAKGNHYEHRLKDYNNDPRTTFADVQRFFSLLEERIRKRLAGQPGHP